MKFTMRRMSVIVPDFISSVGKDCRQEEILKVLNSDERYPTEEFGFVTEYKEPLIIHGLRVSRKNRIIADITVCVGFVKPETGNIFEGTICENTTVGPFVRVETDEFMIFTPCEKQREIGEPVSVKITFAKFKNRTYNSYGEVCV